MYICNIKRMRYSHLLTVYLMGNITIIILHIQNNKCGVYIEIRIQIPRTNLENNYIFNIVIIFIVLHILIFAILPI